MVGDNLGSSRDSRFFGPIPLALIKSKALARVRLGSPMVAWFEEGLHALDEGP